MLKLRRTEDETEPPDDRAHLADAMSERERSARTGSRRARDDDALECGPHRSTMWAIKRKGVKMRWAGVGARLGVAVCDIRPGWRDSAQAAIFLFIFIFHFLC